MKVRIVQTYLIETTDKGEFKIVDNDGLCLTRKPTLQEAIDDVVEMVTEDTFTDDIEVDVVDVIGGGK